MYDERGFNIIIKGEASAFLTENDPRLMLNTIVYCVNYMNDTGTIILSGGGCVEADYAIYTFSLSVLQQEVVDFEAALPYWKTEGIFSLQMRNLYEDISSIPARPAVLGRRYAIPSIRRSYREGLVSGLAISVWSWIP